MEERVDRKFREIDSATGEMQREIERKYIRKMQAKALRQGAECCDNMALSAEEVQRCIEQTQRPLQAIQHSIKEELERFQSRIQRAGMTCQDNARDSYGGTPASEELMKKKFSDCLFNCAEEHLALVPQIKKRIEDAIQKNQS